jgi:hypothetical protein
MEASQNISTNGDPEDIAALSEKMLAVMEEVEYIKKKGENDYHGYSYLTERDLTEKIRPHLIEKGVMIYTSVDERKPSGNMTRVVTEHLIVDAENGASITVQSRGQGQDDQDKGVYKAITGAMKYFLYKTFLVPAGDDPEKDEYLSGEKAQQVYKGAQKFGVSRDELDDAINRRMPASEVSEVHENDKGRVKQIIKDIGTPPNVD